MDNAFSCAGAFLNQYEKVQYTQCFGVVIRASSYMFG
jgi:hypothetical protein